MMVAMDGAWIRNAEAGSSLPVIWSVAGLPEEDQLPVSRIPRGTVTWAGMPYVLWVLNWDTTPWMRFSVKDLVPAGERDKRAGHDVYGM